MNYIERETKKIFLISYWMKQLLFMWDMTDTCKNLSRNVSDGLIKMSSRIVSYDEKKDIQNMNR